MSEALEHAADVLIHADELPERCEQWPCPKLAETWCPLCRAVFCHEHDQLYPLRRHDCLRGRAEA